MTEYCVHKRWPCNTCGIKHYDGCECYFCVSPEKQAEYEQARRDRETRRKILRMTIERLGDKLARL